MVPWLALSGGSFRASRITPHTRSNIAVVEAFAGRRFDIDGNRVFCKEPFHPVVSHHVRNG